MTIAPDSSGATAINVAGTSAVVDITAAAVGAWCYAWCAISTGATTQTGVPSSAGWTAVQSVQTAGGTSGATYAVFRRLKQSGDTTFTFSWATNSGKGAFSWVSWTGVDGSTPDESSAIALNDTVQRSSVPTPSATPTAAGRWAVAFFGQRATASVLKPTSWGPDAALTDRQEADNSTAASSPWLSADIEDSNGTVTVAAHSYTSTSNASNAHDGSAILFLIPAAAAASGTVQPRATVPVPRRRPSRAVVQFRPVAGSNAVPPPPAGTVQPRAALPAPRRRPGRAAVYFRPVTTVNAPPAPAGRVQSPATLPAPRRKPARASWRAGAAPAPVAPGVAVPAPKQLPRVPRRQPSRAVVLFVPVAGSNAPAPPATAAGRPPRGDYDRTRLVRRRYALPRPGEEMVTAGPPAAAEVATGWPGVWPGGWPAVPEPIPEVVPEPEPEPEPEPPKPPRTPVWTRPPKVPRAYPEVNVGRWR